MTQQSRPPCPRDCHLHTGSPRFSLQKEVPGGLGPLFRAPPRHFRSQSTGKDSPGGQGGFHVSEKRRARYGRALLVFYRTHTGEGFSVPPLLEEVLVQTPGHRAGPGHPPGGKDPESQSHLKPCCLGGASGVPQIPCGAWHTPSLGGTRCTPQQLGFMSLLGAQPGSANPVFAPCVAFQTNKI